MSDVAIRVEGLGKEYRIGTKRHDTLRDGIVAFGSRLANTVRRPPDSRFPIPDSQSGHFWALKDVSFEVKRGSVVGIIGRNGAGKSTLLKILSRITEPTAGYAEIRGRVGSLLEVGTGFHPELTGRENIYLNGAILGMRKTEINRRFDEIVAFAEVEQFLDTPVKHYSSGMYVRLAFAVAAHLELEILMVDEVLSVGDAAFQKKCLGKMGDAASAGRTVLFVSHNTSALVSLCQRGILLASGRVQNDDEIAKTVATYLADTELLAVYCNSGEHGDEPLSIDRVSISDNGVVSTAFHNSQTLLLRIECTVRQRIAGAQVAFELLTELNECLFSSTSQDSVGDKPELRPGEYVFECLIKLEMFRQGRYQISVSSSVPGVRMLDVAKRALVFEVLDDSSPVLKLGQGRRGLILPLLSWTISDCSGLIGLGSDRSNSNQL